MTDSQGRSRSVSDVTADNAILLIRMFLEDDAFAKEVQQIRARFQDLAHPSLHQEDIDAAQVIEELQELVEILSTRLEEIAVRGVEGSVDTQTAGQHIDVRALEDMARDAQKVGARFGLKAPWVGYAILLPEVVFDYFNATWNEQKPWAAKVRVNPHVFVQSRYSPLFDRRLDVERDIQTQAKDQLDAIDRQWLRAGVGRQKKKRAEKQHLRWLFLRLRDPKTGQPTRWPKIAEDSKTGVRTVREAVERLALDLQVELPRIPAGRPKKLRK